MTARAQWTAVLAVVAVLGVALFAASRFLGDELFPVTIGTQAPSFSAVEVLEDGTRGPARTLEDYRGRVVLLNIWATWCGPCREEMPSIQALHERFAGDGLSVVAVSVDDPSAGTAIRDFGREYGLTFHLLHDLSGAIQRQYQTTGVPETLIIGRDGRILRKQIGATDWDSPANRALIGQLLGVAPDSAGVPSAPEPPLPGADRAPAIPLQPPTAAAGAER